MDIKSAEQAFQDVTYGDNEYDQLLQQIEQDARSAPYHLSLFIGSSDDSKREAIEQIAGITGREVKTVDANDIATKIESQSQAHIDAVFEALDPADTILHLKNGSRLCGVYTGYTHSRVKYATPQERYFLKKIQEAGGLYVIEIDTDTDADTTIRRAAQSIVHFPPPQSGLKRLFWKIRKMVTVHGHEIKTERPEHYQNQEGNF